MRSAIALLACVVVLVLVNYSIVAKERHLATGKVVYLELAPIDPRSLMQGDYMALRFKIANDARPRISRSEVDRSERSDELVNADGHIVAQLDPTSVATFSRLGDGTPLASNEILLRYRVRNGDVKFATNAYFFQEGTAAKYEAARYGEFRVAPDGELLLTGMRDKELQPL